MALGSDVAASRAASDPGPAADGQAPAVPQAPEELIEIQLRAILEATQTSAGAVCLFDQHQELLRLAVEIGLSDEGCRRLRSVRRGAATTWDMPLHSLLNRRVYLIESAAKNRYVPPLVEDVAMVRAVACVPLYDGSTPVGSLILVALAPRTFGERQIRLLEQPVRDLVGHIVSMRKRVSTAAPQRAVRASLSGTAAAPVPAAAVAVGPTAPGLKTAPAAPGAAGSSSIQAAVDRARVELERLRARLAEAEESAAAERRRAEGLDQELAAMSAERDRVAETLAARTSETGPLADRVATLESALEEARRTEAALGTDLEQARAAAASQSTAASEALAARLAEVESANRELRARVTELEAAEVAARAEAERRVAAATEEATRLAATTANVETRTAALAAEADALRGRLAEAEAFHERERADADARHATALAEVEALAGAARDALAESQRRCEALESELAASRVAAGTHGEQVDALVRERAEREAEVAAARERETELSQRITQLEAEIERTHSEDVQLRDGFAHLESLLQTGVESPAAAAEPEPAGNDDASSFEVIELDEGSTTGDDGSAPGLEVEGLVIEEVEATPPVEAPPAVSAAPASIPQGLLVLDTEDCWTEVAARDAPLTVLAPDGPAPSGHPERILVNLAAAGALAALAALRETGIGASSFGCIRLAGQSRALLLGRLELASRPVDPDALLTGLQGMFARGTRVVTAGADVDALISLRQALARLGVSVSMAWDAKQASDLLAMVRPEIAIIDLDLPPKDGCALVARMGLIQPAPLTIVIPKATDTAPAFATAIAHAELGRATMPIKEVLARVLATSLKAPAASLAARR